MHSVAQAITVAAGQLEARPLDQAPLTLSAIDALIERAAGQRVDLLVLPECAYPAYLIGSVDAYRSADILTAGEYLAHISEQAREYRFNIVSGFIDQTEKALFNAAALIDSRGRVAGTYRKMLLWDKDNDWFQPGQRIQAFDSDMGRIGMVICADTRTPETLATLCADGADLIAMPTCWVNAPDGSPRNPQPEFLIEARAREFHVPFICANKAGMETETVGYCGQSRIVRADGSCAAEAPTHGDRLIVSQLMPRRKRHVWVAERRSTRLRADTPAITPPTEERNVTVAVVPGTLAEKRTADTQLGEKLFEPLQEKGVQLTVTNIAHEVVAERIELMANIYDIKCVAYPTSAEPIKTDVGIIGCVGGLAERSFAAARCLALDGAQWIVIFDAPEDLPMLRARAVENRTFVLAVGMRFGAILDPNGTVLAKTDSSEPTDLIATVNLGLAGRKNVAAGTDVFDQRRPAAYRFDTARLGAAHSP